MVPRRDDWLEKHRPRQWAEFYYGLKDEPVRTAIDQIRCKQYQNTLLVGDYGLGKTSYARVMGARSQCFAYQHHDFEPCGKCIHCVAARRGGGDTVGERYHEMNAAEGELMKTLHRKLYDLRGRTPWPGTETGLPYIIAIDEFHAVKAADQTAILKVLEDEQNVCFLLLTSNDAEVHRAIQSRTVRLDFLPPTKPQYQSWIQRVCQEERITYEPEALDHLFATSRGYPREVLKRAQRLQMRSSHWTSAFVGEFLGLAAKQPRVSDQGAGATTAY